MTDRVTLSTNFPQPISLKIFDRCLESNVEASEGLFAISTAVINGVKSVGLGAVTTRIIRIIIL